MNISAPFIRRPIATCLLALGLLLLGGVAYFFLPVASLPSVDLPIIHVSARQPGASPQTIAATVSAPLERHIGQIPGITLLHSRSSLGGSSILVEFNIGRDIQSAAQDVQSAINAAQADLPSGLVRQPTLRKLNPSAFPILILGMTSSTRTAGEVYDAADTVVAQRIAQIAGVADVDVTGSEQPAIRVAADSGKLTALGLGLGDVRRAIDGANAHSPTGELTGPDRALSIAVNDQLESVAGYRNVIVKTDDGTNVPLKQIASVHEGTLNRLTSASLDGRPAVLLLIHKTAGANVVATVRRIKALLPQLGRWIPAGIDISIFNDSTRSINASVNELQFTLTASIILVMLVVLFFLRRGVPTIAAGVTVPLSLAGTVGLMWACGFSLDNLSLMALTISVGFVVDDAIVMIENVFRNLELGMRPLRAAFAGAKQIGFTVVSITLSLVAAFSPLIMMGGIIGRLLREFSLTLTFAILVSALMSLSVTPMICSRLIRRAPRPRETRFDRLIEPGLEYLERQYERSLSVALRHGWLMLGATLAAVAATVALFIWTPKGVLPNSDTGLIRGVTQASPDTSFYRLSKLQKRVEAIIMSDPAVAHLGSFVGASGGFGSVNEGNMFISLKPRSERSASIFQVIDRLRPKLKTIRAARTYLSASQALPSHANRSRTGQYQFTLWSPDYDLLSHWAPIVTRRLNRRAELVDVATDHDQGGPQATLQIDRLAAARLNVDVNAIDEALSDAFSQRQISTIYQPRNQYKVVLGVAPNQQRSLADLNRIYVSSGDGRQVPLSALTRLRMGLAALSIRHDNGFPSLTVGYSLAPGVAPGRAEDLIRDSIDRLHLPGDVHVRFGSESAAVSSGNEALLLLSALVAVYLVLGILYESLIHPVTILSTLPSAGLGALLALYLTGMELSLISLIGIILLIGIVKKNGIMLVDFALDAERKRGLGPEQAMFEAARVRLRPITMTTVAAVMGAVPLVVATGSGSALRRPLGVTIVGGLIVSQFLTIYTTPVLYLMLDKLRPARWRKRAKPLPTTDYAIQR